MADKKGRHYTDVWLHSMDSPLATNSITVLRPAELHDVLHSVFMARLHLCWRLLSVKGSCSEPRLRLALDCLLSAEDLTSCC